MNTHPMRCGAVCCAWFEWCSGHAQGTEGSERFSGKSSVAPVRFLYAAPVGVAATYLVG